jgi:plastocyanin
VTATNQDPVTHTWTSPGVWDSGDLAPGSAFSFTFAKKGVFNFKCSIHASMTGTVTVT